MSVLHHADKSSLCANLLDDRKGSLVIEKSKQSVGNPVYLH
jgi:hypothetical protein